MRDLATVLPRLVAFQEGGNASQVRGRAIRPSQIAVRNLTFLPQLLDNLEASEEPFSAIRLLTTVGCRDALSGKFGR